MAVPPAIRTGLTTLAAISIGTLLFVLFRKRKKTRAQLTKGAQMAPYVLTKGGQTFWMTIDQNGYLNAGAPAPGDYLTQVEFEAFCLHFGGLQNLLINSFFAAPNMPYIHKQYKCDSRLHEWCETAHEEPQAPLWPSVDPHHHIFDKKVEHGVDLPAWAAHNFSERCSIWIGYSYDQLASDLKGNNVLATVFLECGHAYESAHVDAMQKDPLCSVAETKAIDAIGDASTGPMAIVAFSDLSQGRASVQKAVEAHKKASSRFVGVRHALAHVIDRPIASRALDGQPIEVSRTTAFREGMEVLAEQGLSYDCWLFGHNLPELVDLAKACPRTQIICDHVGAPLGQPLAGYSKEVSMSSWRDSIMDLAACPNVVVKLSGLSMPCCGFGFELLKKPPTSTEMAAAYEPYFGHVLKAFGPKRCFFASNFPVDKASGSFTTHWNAYKILARKLLPGDEAAQRALFYDNAVRIYKLDKPPFKLPATSLEAEAVKLPSY